MTVKTRGGIYLDINKSDIYYAGERYDFYFSSNFYKESFIKKRLQYLDRIETYISNKTKVKTNAKNISDIICYSEVEKRGFKIYDKYSNKYIHSLLDISCEVKIK